MRLDKKQNRLRRARKGRAEIRELEVNRLSIHRTPQHIYAQVIGGDGEQVMASASTVEAEVRKGIKNGGNVGMVADGSQGPAQVVQAGSIMMASRTGSPILPMVWAGSQYIAFKSWDRLALPMPFSTIDFYYGDPLVVPSRLRANSVAFEKYRLELETSLNNLYRLAWSRYGRDRH